MIRILEIDVMTRMDGWLAFLLDRSRGGMFELFNFTCHQNLWFSRNDPYCFAFLSFSESFSFLLNDFVQIRDIHDHCVSTLSTQILEECSRMLASVPTLLC